jgi:hypothetical protein
MLLDKNLQIVINIAITNGFNKDRAVHANTACCYDNQKVMTIDKKIFISNIHKNKLICITTISSFIELLIRIIYSDVARTTR